MMIKKFVHKVLLILLMIYSHAVLSLAPSERWHTVSIDGVVVGSTHEVFESQENQSVSTESSQMVLNRLGTRIEMGLSTKSIENSNGELVSVNVEVQSSEQIIKTFAFREGEQWVTRYATPGVPDQKSRLDKPLIGPHAVARLLTRLSKPGDKVIYHAFVATTMQPGEFQAELVGFETVGEESLKVIKETMQGIPVPMTRVIDDQGRNVITRMTGPFGLTETILADELAASLALSGGELPDEVFEATTLKTGVRLPQPRSLEYLEIELRHRNPALGWPNLSSNNQRVLSVNEKTLVLAVKRHHHGQSEGMNINSSDEMERYLRANSVIQSAQPELVEMAQSLTKDKSDRWQAAQALRRWVSENMSFDAGVVLAPSSEVLANQRGTCSEFAVLLTALSRAAGIPARFVQGYVYAHGMFAGHAWTEVLIDGQWLALDAAIPSEGAADAARFAFAWSDLNEGPGELNAGPSMQMFGQIDARVIAWRSKEGSEQRFPNGAPVPQIKDGRFIDIIQGIEWSVPEAWTVVDYQETWPSNLVAAVERSNGDRVELRWVSQHPWERAGIDWFESHHTKRSKVESKPFGHPDSWLIKQDGQFRLVVAGLNGHWQLVGNDREHLRELTSGLLLPSL